MKKPNHLLLTSLIASLLPLMGTASADPKKHVFQYRESDLSFKQVKKPILPHVKKSLRAVPIKKKQQAVNTPSPVNKFSGSMGGAGQANLVIEVSSNKSNPEGFPNSGFCGSNGSNGGPSDWVRFRVRNKGSVASVVSVTTMHWSSGSQNMSTPAINPGATALMNMPMPQSCWPNTAHGSCDFLLEADRNDTVSESSETDNYSNGSCMLPGT